MKDEGEKRASLGQPQDKLCRKALEGLALVFTLDVSSQMEHNHQEAFGKFAGII